MTKRAPKQPWRPRFGWVAAVALATAAVIATAGCATLDFQTSDSSSLTNQHELAPNADSYGFTQESAPDPDTVAAPIERATVAIAVSSATQMTAIALLETLTVKGKSPMTGYERTGQFGPAWLDMDRNGCDTRFPGWFGSVRNATSVTCITQMTFL